MNKMKIKMKGGKLKNMNKTIFGIIAIVFSALLLIGLTSAFGGFGFGKAKLNMSDDQKAALEQKRDAIWSAIESEDYEKWKSLMQSEITQENFDKLVEQHKEMSKVHDLREQLREAIESGDESKVSELRAQLSELGFENGFNKGGKGKGNGMGQGRGMHSQGCPMLD